MFSGFRLVHSLNTIGSIGKSSIPFLNDKAFGLYKAAKYYYYPGWHEPGTVLEGMINQKAFEALPADLQDIVMVATRAANQDMMDELTYRNALALKELVTDHGTELRKLPDEVFKKLRVLSDEVVFDEAKKDDLTRRIYDSFMNFRSLADEYQKISEYAYLHGRIQTGA